MHALKPILAFALVATAAPLSAIDETRPTAAPEGTETTRYCMRVEAVTGTRIERIRCWTRAEWERQGVDLDKDWPREGVRVIE